jgi:hypothetical protein
MASSFKHNGNPVSIRFDLYNASDDNQFKLELISLMICNIAELKDSAHASYSAKDVVIFEKIVHKAKATTSLVDDKDFTNAIYEFREDLSQNASCPDVKKLNHLNEICESIICSLETEKNVLQSS